MQKVQASDLGHPPLRLDLATITILAGLFIYSTAAGLWLELLIGTVRTIVPLVEPTRPSHALSNMGLLKTGVPGTDQEV